MAANNTPVWSYVLTNGTIVITVADNIKIIALNYVSGTVTVTGGATVQTLVSYPISITSTNPNITIGGEEFPINLLTINASAGVVQIIAYF